MDIEKAFDISFKKGHGVSNEKERFARSNCKSGDESLPRGKNDSFSGI